MKESDGSALLLHILDAVTKLEATRAAGRQAFVNSPDAADATKQRLTTIAISVPRLPEDMRKRHPSVDWRALADVLPLVYRDYPTVRIELFWNFLTGDLPVLKDAIDEEVKSLPAPGGGTAPDAH